MTWQRGRIERPPALRGWPFLSASPIPHVDDDAAGNRFRARQAHRRAGGSQARRRDRAAQPLAAPAGGGAAAPGNHAEEHPDDRADGRRQDRDRAPPRAPRRRAVHQGRGDEVHRGRLRRPRRRHDHPRPCGGRGEADARDRSAQGARPCRRRRRGAHSRRAAAAGARSELPRHAADRLGDAPALSQDAARRASSTTRKSRSRSPRSRSNRKSWRRRAWKT